MLSLVYCCTALSLTNIIGNVIAMASSTNIAWCFHCRINFFSSFCFWQAKCSAFLYHIPCVMNIFFFFIRVLQRSLFLNNWLPGLCYSFRMTCFICTCFLFLLVFQSCQRGRRICRIACYLFLFYLLKCLLFTLYRQPCHCEWRALHRVFRPQIF